MSSATVKIMSRWHITKFKINKKSLIILEQPKLKFPNKNIYGTLYFY